MYSSIAASTPSHQWANVSLAKRADSRCRYASMLRMRQRLHDGPLVREELVDRADGDLGPLGEQGRGQALVPDLIDELGAGVEHALDPGNASALHRDPPQRPGGDGLVSTRVATPSQQ